MLGDTAASMCQVAALPPAGLRVTLYRTTINLVRKPESEIQAALEAAAAAAAPATGGKGGKAAAAAKGKKGAAEEPSTGEDGGAGLRQASLQCSKSIQVCSRPYHLACAIQVSVVPTPMQPTVACSRPG
jgi:hypothetical protein